MKNKTFCLYRFTNFNTLLAIIFIASLWHFEIHTKRIKRFAFRVKNLNSINEKLRVHKAYRYINAVNLIMFCNVKTCNNSIDMEYHYVGIRINVAQYFQIRNCDSSDLHPVIPTVGVCFICNLNAFVFSYSILVFF